MRASVLTILVASCGSSPAPAPLPDANAREIAISDPMLLLGGVTEGTLTGGPDDVARIVLAAPGTFDWSLHSHVNGTETVHAEPGVTAADYVFVPSASTAWFLKLTNASATPVTIHVELSLYGAMTWSGWN